MWARAGRLNAKLRGQGTCHVDGRDEHSNPPLEAHEPEGTGVSTLSPLESDAMRTVPRDSTVWSTIGEVLGCAERTRASSRRFDSTGHLDRWTTLPAAELVPGRGCASRFAVEVGER
jgi:hypothetical protein